MDKSIVYLTKIDKMRENLLSSLDFINWNKVVKNDSTVFLKPNFTYPYHKKGITTTPEFLEEFLYLLKGRAKRVIIGESDGGNNSFSADDSFAGHNIPEICRKTGSEYVNLSKIPSTAVTEKIQGKDVMVRLPNLLLRDIDCMISAPVLKVHVMTGVSLSMKNLWGCYPDAMRCLHHKDLDRKLALITKLTNPQLIAIDGSYALDNHGPMYGTAKKTNLLLFSNNPVAADMIGASIMGIPLTRAKHIVTAQNEDLGPKDRKEIIMNADPDGFKMQFEIERTVIDRMSYLLFNSEMIAKLVMDSRATPLIYKIAGHLRTKDESEVVDDLRRYYL